MRCKSFLRSLVGAVALTLALAGTATGAEGEARGIDPNQGLSLVEVHLDSKADAIALQLKADEYGIDFNEHYLRHEGNGGVVVTVFGSAEELDALEAAGYNVGRTIEGPATWRDRAQDWIADVKREEKAEAAARGRAPGAGAPAGTRAIGVRAESSRSRRRRSSPRSRCRGLTGRCTQVRPSF